MARRRPGSEGTDGNAQRRVTMTDVARLAGCSQSTVSVVLNNTPGIKISASTRERVIASAQGLNYDVPRGAVTSIEQPAQVAVLFDRIGPGAEATGAIEAIGGIRDGAWMTGHVVTLCETMQNEEMEDRALQVLLHGEIELVIYATATTREVTVPRRLSELAPPVVLLNCYTADGTFPSVIPGEVAGGQRATEALIDAGHKRIAIITGELRADAGRDRLRGYRQALATADIAFDPALVGEGSWQTADGYRQANALMNLPRPPTAIFCSNVDMAIGCYEALRDRRLAIPDDVSVIGYDDKEIARHLSPPLTTLALPHREMGRLAIEYGFTAASSGPRKHRVTKLECPLIQRASISAVKSGLVAPGKPVDVLRRR